MSNFNGDWIPKGREEFLFKLEVFWDEWHIMILTLLVTGLLLFGIIQFNAVVIRLFENASGTILQRSVPIFTSVDTIEAEANVPVIVVPGNTYTLNFSLRNTDTLAQSIMFTLDSPNNDFEFTSAETLPIIVVNETLATGNAIRPSETIFISWEEQQTNQIEIITAIDFDTQSLTETIFINVGTLPFYMEIIVTLAGTTIIGAIAIPIQWLYKQRDKLFGQSDS